MTCCRFPSPPAPNVKLIGTASSRTTLRMAPIISA
jgi:hypothetical protein